MLEEPVYLHPALVPHVNYAVEKKKKKKRKNLIITFHPEVKLTDVSEQVLTVYSHRTVTIRI